MRRCILICALGLLAARAEAKDDLKVLPVTGVLPQQKYVELRIDPNAQSKHPQVPPAKVEEVIARAVTTWNRELAKASAEVPAGALQIMKTRYGAPVKKGQVMIVCRFDRDAGHFKGGGIDEYAYTETAVTAAHDLVTFISFNDSDAFYANPGSDLAGEKSSIDFELVALHELGHALGLGHEGTGQAPPIMAPLVDWNAVMGAPAKLHAPAPEDGQALRRLLRQRAARNVVGSWTCTLKPSSGQSLDLPLSIEAAENLVVSSGAWSMAVPVEALFAWPLEFPRDEVKRTGTFDAFKLLIDPQEHVRAIVELSSVHERLMCTLTRK